MTQATAAKKTTPKPATPRKRPQKIADLLCGAGGSSSGAKRALEQLGLEMDLVCVNHWDVAIETHSKNHPNARHYCQDIAAVRPIEICPEGYLDLLMASPTCTHHSRARGGKPTSDQQRADPWHIITWLTELRVKRIMIENVPEFVEWGPVDVRTMRPIKSRKGEYFRAWTAALKGLGFSIDWGILNCADFGDATTRQRFFLIGRSDGLRPEWPTPTHSKNGTGDLFGAGTKRWRPAREIIDWNLKGQSIFNRKRALADKTLARIYAGAVKFKWPEPFLVILRQHMAGRSVDDPLPAITANGTHIGLAEPLILPQSSDHGARSADQPVPTITTISRVGIVEPVAQPMIFPLNQGKERLRGHRTVEDPLCTITATGTDLGLVEPFIATVAHGDEPGEADPFSRRARSIEEPLQTITAGGNKFAIVEPFILNRHGDNGATRAHNVDLPMPTADTSGAGYVVEPVAPFVLSQASGGAPRSVEEPMPTMTTGGNGGSHALIAPYYGSGSGETYSSPEDPLPTVTTKGRFGIVVPVTNSTGGPNPRSVEEPLPTITTAKGGEMAMVMPVTHHDGSDRARDVDSEPLPTVTGANRGELAFVAATENGQLAFITAAFGERPGQDPRVHSVDGPTPTICSQGRINLVQGDERRYDILFRMLQPHELAAASSFTTEEARYEFAGTKTEIVKQIGGAVPVMTAMALVGALMRR